MDAPTLELDAALPIPLYRQLAEALRYRISRGLLVPGTRLPGVREAARAWRVNLHTVRRGYHELQRAGLVEVRRPGGTQVALGARALTEGEGLRFAREVIAEAHRRLGLDPAGVAALIARVAAPPRPPIVQVIECSRQLAGSLARELESRLGVAATPRLLGEWVRVGPEPVVATWFHYTEVRSRLPERTDDVQFAVIEPALSSADEIVRRAVKSGGVVTLAERDALLAPAIAADVARLLADSRVRVSADSRTGPAALLRRRKGPVVCSPGSWELLSPEERKDPNAVLLEYHFSADALAQLAKAFGVSLPPT